MLRVPLTIRYKINAALNIFDVLERLYGVAFPRGKGVDQHIFCPFHADTVHKSARVYADSNALYCFTEMRRYDVTDALVLYYKPVSVQKLLERIRQDWGVDIDAVSIPLPTHSDISLEKIKEWRKVIKRKHLTWKEVYARIIHYFQRRKDPNGF